MTCDIIFMLSSNTLHRFFARPPNCAQKVLIANQYRLKYNITDKVIEDARKDGTGHAPGGLCGSIYTAAKLINNEEKKNKMYKEFEEKAGSLYCKEIRKLGKLSCPECAAASIDILLKYE